jgi:hypothetical protein
VRGKVEVKEEKKVILGVLHKRSSATHDDGDYLEPHNKETAVAIVTFRELCSFVTEEETINNRQLLSNSK